MPMCFSGVWSPEAENHRSRWHSRRISRRASIWRQTTRSLQGPRRAGESMHPRFFSLYTRGRLVQLQCVPSLFWLGDTAIRCSDPLTWPSGIADACGRPSVFHARGHHRASCFLTPPSPSLHFHSFLVSRRTRPRGHTMGDHRLVVGTTVHEKVRHLRSALTCALLLGSRADDAMPSGMVTAVMRSKVDGRTSTTTSGPFECVGTTVVKTLGLRTIRSGPAPALAPSTPPSISPPDATAAQQTTMTLSPPPPADTARDTSRDPIAQATGLSSTAFSAPAVGGPVTGHNDFGDEPPLLSHCAPSLSAPRAPPIGTPFTPPSTQDTSGDPLTTLAGPPASGLEIPKGMCGGWGPPVAGRAGRWCTWPADRPCWWLDGFRGRYTGLARRADRGCDVAV